MARKISLAGKRVFLTGVGDDRGLGALFAEELASRQATVYCVDINPNVHNVAKRLGDSVYSRVVDVTDYEQVQEVVETAVACMGDIDIVIANAGMADVTTYENDPNRYKRVRDVNELGTYNTIRATKPYIMEPGKYVLVNTSNGSNVSLELMGAYNASKAHANRLGEWLQLELKGTGARAGLLLLSEHSSPMEDNFKRLIPQILMDENPLLKRGHKERDPRHAVDGMVRAIEGRRLYTHVPRYSVMSRYFPALVNWISRAMHRKVKTAVEASRVEYENELSQKQMKP